MQQLLTLSTKGQFTLPAKVRKSLGVVNKGDVLQLEYNASSGTVRLTKPSSLRDVQTFVESHSNNKDIPSNLHDWYMAERIKDLRKGRRI